MNAESNNEGALAIADAKLVPFSSVVGQSIALMDSTGRVIGQLSVLNLPVGTDYRTASRAVAQQVVDALLLARKSASSEVQS